MAKNTQFSWRRGALFLVCTEVCWPYVGVMNPGSEAVDSECGGGSQDNYVGPLPAWFEGLTMVSLDEYPVSWLVAMRFWHRMSRKEPSVWSRHPCERVGGFGENG